MNLYGKFIRHKRFMDICFDVKKSFDAGHKVKLGGYWWNQGFVKSYKMNIKENIVILKEDYKDWEFLANPQSLTCFRNGNWRPIVR